jgi:hypothetical protein
VRLELEIQIIFVPPSQFDAKLLLLSNTMQLEVNRVLVPLLDYLHEFDLKKCTHNVGNNV